MVGSRDRWVGVMWVKGRVDRRWWGPGGGWLGGS